ncbi:MAG: stage sporulation protein [Oscillospiraceae bacterium]|jgi:stage III sporulation protein AA|nr:stage sporulation protein [Oscillospiraceae bacterium]
MNDIFKFNQAVNSLSPNIKNILINVSDDIKKDIKEIRIRAGRPLSMGDGTQEMFVLKNSGVIFNYREGAYHLTRFDLNECFKVLCNYSIHSYQSEIKNGFITIEGGHRAGICGTAIVENGQVCGIRDISSINLRIARQIDGVSDELMRKTFSNGVCGVLIVGAPSSGKTTVLRDLIRQLSSGNLDGYKKVAVIDERGELAATHKGQPQNNIGLCCDVLDGYPKGEGMNIALRTMSPQVIVCDEIGNESDAGAIQNSLNAGVDVIATAHASNIGELLKRKHIANLIKSGAFKKIVILEGAEHPSKIKEVISMEGFDDKVYGHIADNISV